MMEHGSAITALLYLPILVMVLLVGMDFGERRGYALAVRFMAGYRTSGGGARLAALLMAMTALIHLALVPAHSDEPVTAILFAADGLALGVLAVAAVLGAGPWRPAAAAVLTASVLAYGYYLGARLETVDVIGVVTKLIEVGAVFLIVIRPLDRFVSTVGRIGSQKNNGGLIS